MRKQYSFSFVITLVLAASAFTCLIMTILFIFSGNLNTLFFARNTTENEQVSQRSNFDELLKVVDNRFIGAFDLNELEIIAMRAAIDALDDDWSYYMSPDEYADFLENSNNQYHGIGVEVVLDEITEGMKVLRVYKDSGADKAGILANDIVTAVDGESILGLTLTEIRNMLRRELGDTAVVTVMREDGTYHDLTVIYNLVFTDPVIYKMIDNNIGYVLLRNFEEGAGDRFISAVNELIENGAAAFIYDVRSNNGGRVGEVTKILDFLLPEGEIFISVDRSGVENITWSDAEFIDLPAVVLVNSFSYSGAEFFAAMLYEYEYATTVGEQTTGKNRMQTTIPLSNGGAVHISTGHYLTKNRISLFDTDGFTPDYIVTLDEDKIVQLNRGELDPDSDPQLHKALSLLEAKLKPGN